MKLNRLYLAMGSNTAPEQNLAAGLRLLKVWFYVVAVSPVYESAPVDDPAAAPFLNAVVQVDTYVFLDLVRRRLRMIEARLGRVRYDTAGQPVAAVPLDLDVLLFNQEINRSIVETLPHPDIVRYAHVAVPLAQLAPALRHPVTGEPLAAIAERLGSATLKPRSDIHNFQ
ncbi:MAG: 2-amino-4-hydroxy-6-hydroxymethyldihydropteridine diphosphokinase [Anaerolineae bacterium]|jgi:2-amino-4-hydroxy-6-hydroxymethyldihydropteridine diphosphokinase|nr:2-amino-4-hydroxy-6-hydroxymethyldihydropteridine diphosphokinase [Anaerolineae bacterium]